MYTKTVKVKLLPSPEQSEHMMETLRRYTAACNYCAKCAITHGLESTNKLVKMTYRDVISQFGLRSQMAQSVARTAMNGIRAARTRFKRKWVHCTFSKLEYDVVYNSDYGFNETEMSISSIKGRLIMPYETTCTELLWSGGKVGTGRIIRRDGVWYILIPVTFNEPVISSNDPIYVGIDLGLNFIASIYDSDGNCKFYKGKKLKQMRRAKKLFRKRAQTKNTKSAKAMLRRFGHKEANFRSNMNHVITKEIVNAYPPGTVFIMEDLKNLNIDIMKKTNGKEFHYDLSSWAYADFIIKLTYKAKERGSIVILVPPKHTSQTCPVCGYIDKANRDREKHEFWCKSCGYRTNDDRAAAINILNRGIQLHNATDSQA